MYYNIYWIVSYLVLLGDIGRIFTSCWKFETFTISRIFVLFRLFQSFCLYLRQFEPCSSFPSILFQRLPRSDFRRCRSWLAFFLLSSLSPGSCEVASQQNMWLSWCSDGGPVPPKLPRWFQLLDEEVVYFYSMWRLESMSSGAMSSASRLNLAVCQSP